MVGFFYLPGYFTFSKLIMFNYRGTCKCLIKEVPVHTFLLQPFNFIVLFTVHKIVFIFPNYSCRIVSIVQKVN